MASAAATIGDGEKPRAHLGQPLLAPPQPPQQPYYAYPAASYAHPSPPPPAPTLVFVPVPAPCSPVLVRLRRLRPRRAPCLRRLCTRTLPLLLFLALLAGAAFLLYPSAPAARVADLRVDSFRVQPPVLDLGLALRLRVRNPGFVLPLRYRSVSAAVSYRGHLLGSAKAWPRSGELAARHEVYADAQVWVDAGRVLDDVIELIADVAAGSVPLEIVSEVVGSIEVFRFHIPVKVIACSRDRLFTDFVIPLPIVCSAVKTDAFKDWGFGIGLENFLTLKDMECYNFNIFSCWICL